MSRGVLQEEYPGTSPEGNKLTGGEISRTVFHGTEERKMDNAVQT